MTHLGDIVVTLTGAGPLLHDLDNDTIERVQA